jgi:hypothetical protein
MILAEGAASDYIAAVDLLERGLQTGNTSLLEQARHMIGQGGPKLQAATPLLSEAQALFRQASAGGSPRPAQGEPANRTDSVLGQTGTFCKDNTRLALRVVEAAEARRDVVSLILEATNLGTRSENVFRMVDLRDQRSRNFDMAGSSEYSQYFDDLRQLRDRGVVSHVTDIQPGRTELVYMAFLVAPDSTSFQLAQRRPPCA